MESSSFAMDANVLESNLFMNQTGKKGKNQICPNYLPHLFHYIKTLLSETERNSLKDYEVQVFIIETAIGQTKFTDLNVLCDFIIKEIRGDIRYWIKGTEPFMKIYEDLKKIGENDEKLDSVVLSMKEENENAFKEFTDYHQKMDILLKEEVKDGTTKENKDKLESKTMTEEVIRPAVEGYIPQKMNFNYDIYEVAVDNYYLNKTETYSKKVRTRWQDRRDKRFLDYPQEVVKNYINIFKELRDNDPSFAQSIFVCNRNMKIPRIDIQLFPLIFQFLMKKHDIDIKIKTGSQVFLFQRIQNLIYLCLMTDDKTHALISHHRVYKGAFLENPNARKTSNDIEDADEDQEEGKKMEEEEEDGMQEEDAEDGSMTNGEESAVSAVWTDFKQFSYLNGIDIDALFGNDRDSRQRKINLLNNALRICMIFVEKLSKWELSVIPTLEAQDATFDNFKIRELINRLDDSEFFSDNILESIIDYYHLEFEHRNILQYIEGLQQYRSYSLKSATSTAKADKEEMQGVFSDKKFCHFAMESYQNYFNSPTIAKKRSYIFHTSHRKKFSQEECKKFLEGLYKYFDTPVNNKKIAKHIGPHIKSNHIRFIKGRYLRKLRKRAKAENITMLDLLKDHINTNNIKEVAESL